MPRSKPQDTRRKLNSAMNHIVKAVSNIYDILPVDMDVHDWDERYLELLKTNIQLMELHHRIDSILNPEKINDEGDQDVK